MYQHYWTIFLIATATVAGCRPSGPPTYLVTGSVTVDEQPLTIGEIVFAPEDRTIGPRFGEIVNGKYRLHSTVGKQQVRITASREVPGSEGQGFRGALLIENYIPAQYNSATILSVEVSPDDDNRFDFELASQRGN